MPYVSKAQQGFAHTPTAAAKGFPTAEFDAASKGLTGLPQHVGAKGVKKSAKPKSTMLSTPVSKGRRKRPFSFPPASTKGAY